MLAKCRVVKYEDSTALSKISLFLLLPAAIVNAFDFALTPDLARGIALSFAAAVLIHLLFRALDALYQRRIGNDPVERASVMYSNAGNLIIPIVSYVLGGEWVVYSTAYMSVQLVFLWSHGIRLFSKGERFQIKKVLLNVNIIAIVLGVPLMLSGCRLPAFVKGITSSLGDMLGTVAMLIAGILASQVKFSKSLREAGIRRALFFRMALLPLMVLALLKGLSFIPVLNAEKVLLISFLASITPPAATVMQFANLKGGDCTTAAATHIFGTLLCAVTMPLWVMLFQRII